MTDMKKRNCMVSVIVPVYNKKEYLGACIDSILGQSYRNMELVLVDDASTDGSGEICDAYGDKDSRVKVIRQENGGPTSACVTGMREASGDYYMFVDSDDYIDGCMVEEMVKHLAYRPGEIVCCNHILEKKKKTLKMTAPVRPGVYEGEKLQKEVKDRLIGSEQRLIPMSRCMKLCERSVFAGNEKYYDMSIRMGDDFHLIYPALLNSTRIVAMEDAAYYHYRYVGDSIVHNYSQGMFDSIQAWYKAMRRIVQDKYPDRAGNGETAEDRTAAGNRAADKPTGQDSESHGNAADIEAALQREYCYMLMLVMKNELRAPGRGYAARIRDIFYKKEIRECILQTPLSVRERSNQLIYLGMQYPEKGLIRILRCIMKLHDRV